jgi:hypothetical protein
MPDNVLSKRIDEAESLVLSGKGVPALTAMRLFADIRAALAAYPTPQPGEGYPRVEGDFLIIGPECFMSDVVSDSPISYQGENYYLDSTRTEPNVAVQNEKHEWVAPVPTAGANREQKTANTLSILLGLLTRHPEIEIGTVYVDAIKDAVAVLAALPSVSYPTTAEIKRMADDLYSLSGDDPSAVMACRSAYRAGGEAVLALLTGQGGEQG